MHWILDWLVAALLCAGLETPSPDPARAVATTRAGEKIAGGLQVDSRGSPRFVALGDRSVLALSDLQEIAWPEPREAARPKAPFQFHFAGGSRLSGDLVSIDARTVRLKLAGSSSELACPRAAIRRIIRAPTESIIAHDSFEADTARVAVPEGTAQLDPSRARSGHQSLRLSAPEAAFRKHLATPIAAGQISVAWLEGPQIEPAVEHAVELLFVEPGMAVHTVRIVLGMKHAMLAIESPRGPTIAIQPMPRAAGWHQLDVRFEADAIAIDCDGALLGSGRMQGQSLAQVALISRTKNEASAIWFDDFEIKQVVAPSALLERDATQDELRLDHSDQVFGAVLSGDARALQVSTSVDASGRSIPWSAVGVLIFRDQAGPAQPLAGEWVRLHWHPVGTQRPASFEDMLEGVFQELSDSEIVLDVPYFGLIRAPRAGLARLVILGKARRFLIDGIPHHLGDRLVADLDPPQPSSNLVLDFKLGENPPLPAELVLDIVQLVGVTGTPGLSELVAQGQLRTKVRLNDHPLDDLNLQIDNANETPTRIRLAIPTHVLRPGANRLIFDQTGIPDEPEKRDNMGLLGVAIEWPALDGSNAPVAQP